MSRLHHAILRMRSFKNWPLFIWPFTRIGSKARVAVLRNGARIALRNIFSTDLSVAMDFSPINPYDDADMGNPSTIVDVGANIGIFTVLIARKFPQAKIYAIEPEESNYNQLLKNIALNGLNNVIPMRAIVAAEPGTRTLYLSTLSDCHSMYYGKTETKQEVAAITLASLGKIDLLKVDAEGAEYEIFRDYIPECAYIVMEVHPVKGHDETDLIDKFRQKYSVVNESPIYKFRAKNAI